MQKCWGKGRGRESSKAKGPEVGVLGVSSSDWGGLGEWPAGGVGKSRQPLGVQELED